jgi:YegS/Rv2252/BmrU family lipid kinase
MKVAVVAHSGKTLGGGLLELRQTFEAERVTDLSWAEVPKSSKAPREVRRALRAGADVVFAWGGDGMVQRCVDVLAGSETDLAIIPAGTANLFATNLGIPKSIPEAVALGLRGARRRLDLGRFNGERFAVMAGAGFDAAMIRGSGGLKDQLGRVAYIVSGSEKVGLKPFQARIKVDGATWFSGKATCLLIGNVGRLFGGIQAFEDAQPDDGFLELGVVTADGPIDWARTMTRTVIGSAADSPFVQLTRARTIDVKLSRKVRYELDGGDRSKVKSFKARVEPGAVNVCVPATAIEDRREARDEYLTHR